MRFHSLSGSPFVPSSKAFSDSRLLFLEASMRTDEHSEHGDGDLDPWNLSMESMSSDDSFSSVVLRASGHGVMASISSMEVDRAVFLETFDMLLYNRLISNVPRMPRK